MRILIVEDEPHISAAIERGLLAEGFSVDVATDGRDGLWRAREGNYAAIVLDILLPGMNGFDVCEKLRQEGNQTPILMLTAKSGEYDEAEGLDTGADDFLRKPFSFVVLVARIKALLRRGQNFQNLTLTYGALQYNPQTRECLVNNRSIPLTGREGAVFEILIRAQGETVPKQKIISQVWGMDFDGDPNILDVYIGYLRRKLDKNHPPCLLKTVHGLGYQLVLGNA